MLASGQWPVMMKMPFPMMISWRINVVRKPNFQRECTVLVLPESRSSSRWWQSRARASWGTSPTSFWLRSETGQLLPETAKKSLNSPERKRITREEILSFYAAAALEIVWSAKEAVDAASPTQPGTNVAPSQTSFLLICTNSLQLPSLLSTRRIMVLSIRLDLHIVCPENRVVCVLHPSCSLHLSALCSYLVQNSSTRFPSLASSLCIAPGVSIISRWSFL